MPGTDILEQKNQNKLLKSLCLAPCKRRKKLKTKGLPYEEIATSYDYILRHVDYEKWYKYLKTIMLAYAENPKTVLELGCGTGKFGAKFSAQGYETYGLDISMNMLRVAKTRAFRNFRILRADMKTFKLKKTMDFIFCVHDALNYQLSLEGVREIFQNIKHVMHEKSIFFFDITTEYNVKRFFENKTSTYKNKGEEVEWSNTYDDEEKIITSNFVINRGGEISKESHQQKMYSIEEISAILREENFKILEIFCDYSFEPPDKEAVMINFITSLKRHR